MNQIHRDKEVKPMSFMPIDFLEDMERMRREIDRILGDDRFSAWTFPFSRISFLPGRASRAYPLMNISEDDNNFYVDALAPGIEPKTLNVSVTGNQLVISGEKGLSICKGRVYSSQRAERRAVARSLSLSMDRTTRRSRPTTTTGCSG
jgi:HSP20 family protein